MPRIRRVASQPSIGAPTETTPEPQQDQDRDKFVPPEYTWKRDVTRNPRLLQLDHQEQFNRYFAGRKNEPAAKLAYDVLRKVEIDLVMGASNIHSNSVKTSMWSEGANLKCNQTLGGPGELTWIKSPQLNSRKWLQVLKLRPEPTLSAKTETARIIEQLKPALSRTIRYAVEAYHDRSGNCGHQASLALYYLLKSGSAEIFRIEMAYFTDLDHQFLVVNRKRGSDIRDCKTWGKNAFVLDPWLKDLKQFRIYPGSVASGTLQKVRQWCHQNDQTMRDNLESLRRNLYYQSYCSRLREIPWPSGKSDPIDDIEDGKLPLQTALDLIDFQGGELLPDINELELK